MNQPKNWGKTVLGWFVVQEEGTKPSPEEADPDAILNKYAGVETPSEPEPSKTTKPSLKVEGIPISPPGEQVVPVPVNFAEVFGAAGIKPEEQECVRRAVELLQSLPAETPMGVQKQIVETSLRVFGFSTQAILEAAVAEIEALQAFQEISRASLLKQVEETNARIALLEGEIARVRDQISLRVREQEGQRASCEQHQHQLQRVLGFFGQNQGSSPTT